jgi:ATP-binding cassette, subfamily B, bacterial MsbA
MQHSGMYRRLYNMQFSEDDVATSAGGETVAAVGLEGMA